MPSPRMPLRFSLRGTMAFAGAPNGNIVSPADSSLAPEGNSGQRFGTWLTIIAMNIVRMLLYVVGYASLILISGAASNI